MKTLSRQKSSLDLLAQIIAEGVPKDISRDKQADKTREALKGIFGERYPRKLAQSDTIFRTVLMSNEDNISFAGLLHEDSPTSGVYGGMSLMWFPMEADEETPACSLLTFVCGTRGLAPDEQILGRPGHARHLHALRRHLSETCGVSMWTKQDPTNLGQPFPQVIASQLVRFKQCLDRYGNYIYATVEVPHDPDHAYQVVQACVDFYAWERGWQPMKAAEPEVTALKQALRAELFPRVSRAEIVELLKERRFVVLQGPPGTGKTRLSGEILSSDFKGHGVAVQFHPAVTYESFISGISPDVKESTLRFDVKAGWLVESATAAQDSKSDYLLHIDEINRADLGRVLGEAIYLFEPREIAQGQSRRVQLPHPLNGSSEFSLPPNLYILGTMNSADRSIAILDLAVRRRFAFVDVWPDLSVIEAQGLQLATEAFGRLQDIFAQYAPADALVLLPGHAYFLANDKAELARRLRYELMPLISEYLQEGRLGACESELHAYLDWLEGELMAHGAEA
ncbi:AAA family ATPase [bacterium]|nr:AAA family ATPase [bacterium]